MSISNFIASAEAVTLTQLGADGQKVIADAVTAAEALGGTGTVKFSAALSQSLTDLTALGKDVGLFAVGLAIETAVAKLGLPATAATPPVATPSA